MPRALALAAAALAVILAAATAGAGAPPQRRHQRLGHISAKARGGLDPLSAPEISGGYRAALARRNISFGEGFRRLARRADGSFPHTADSHSYTGATDRGFIAYSYFAAVRNTTVATDDYHALLRHARAVSVAMDDAFAEPAPAGTAPHYINVTSSASGNNLTTLVRNNVRLRLRVPALAAAAHSDAVAHLAARLAVRGAAIAFGLEIMREHADFAVNNECEFQLPYTAPYYAVEAARETRSAGAVEWVLDLRPVQAASLFQALVSDLHFDPDVERGLTRIGAQRASARAATRVARRAGCRSRRPFRANSASTGTAKQEQRPGPARQSSRC